MQSLLLFKLLLAGIACLVIICLFFLHRERKARLALVSKYQAMALLHKNARKQYETLMLQFTQLQFGNLSMGKKIAQLSKHFDDLAEKQNQFEICDSGSKLYSRASKMVELGADLNELMEECELPKAEAELLLNLKKKKRVR